MSALDLIFHKNQGFPHYSAHDANPQSGSAITIIFILVALFAALIFAVSSGSRSGADKLSGQQADLVATEVLSYANTVKNAVRQLIISGCNQENELSFYSTQFAFPSRYGNTNAPADNSCSIFHPNGGGVSWQPPPKEIVNFGYNEYSIHSKHSIEDIGDNSNNELLITTRIPLAICKSINRKLSIITASGDPPVDDNASHAIPIGEIFIYGQWLIDSNNNAFAGGGTSVNVSELNGKMSGCWENSGNYYFYSVLVAR